MGIVDQVGSGVTLLKKGDRVVMPFNVADGRCVNCEEGRTAFCTGVNPGFAGGAYGYVAMGPYAGGQVRSQSLVAFVSTFPAELRLRKRRTNDARTEWELKSNPLIIPGTIRSRSLCRFQRSGAASGH